jgi:phage gp29-like protein
MKPPVTIPQAGAPAQTPTVGYGVQGKSDAQLVRSANRWRDNYNPLRSLVLSRVVSFLEAGERGEFADLQWLYRMIERRYPVLRALIKRRRAALQKLEYKVKIMETLPPGADEALAEQQRAWLQSRYDLIANLRDAIKQLALAEFRGFTILAKHTFDGGPNDGAVCELHWLPQWNIVRDGTNGDWFWNPGAQAVSAVTLGADRRIDPETVLIRECDMPVNEIAVIAFVRSNLCKKDWIAFCELFGIARAIVIMPPGEPPAGKESEYRAAAESVSEGASGALPNGADAKFPSAGVRGSHPFKEFIDAEKEDVVLAGTGGKLTMLNEATGIGGSQGEVHDDAFDDIAQDEAIEISEIFQRQFDEAELERQFPGQPRCVYFEICAKEEEERTSVITNAKTLKDAGWKMETEQLEELTGYELEEVETPVAGVYDARSLDDQRSQAAAADAGEPASPRNNRALQQLRSSLAAVLRNRGSDLQKGVQELSAAFKP